MVSLPACQCESPNGTTPFRVLNQRFVDRANPSREPDTDRYRKESSQKSRVVLPNSRAELTAVGGDRRTRDDTDSEAGSSSRYPCQTVQRVRHVSARHRDYRAIKSM